jgi:uncharacterized protein YndB with AHSA1/START domain
MPATKPGSRAETAADRSIIATRVFDAPRDLVFSMWSDPAHISKWWGPIGFTTIVESMDFRPGGEWKFVMRGPDGTDYRNHIVYREIVKPERIAYSHLNGPVFDAAATFTAQGRKTLVEVRMVFASGELRDQVVRQFGAVDGLHQTLGRLDEELGRLAGQAFTIRHTFDAKRDLVFRLWTEERHLRNWFGPKGTKIFSAANDPRSGGLFLYGMRTADGGEMWGRWVYREIAPPERLVFVSSFSDRQGTLQPPPFPDPWPVELLSVITFEDRGSKTDVTVTWLPLGATAEEWQTFDAGRASMNGGWTGTFRQLDAYIASL